MLIHMENSRGVSVDILTTGASVYRITAPDRYGRPANITMTLNSQNNYGKDLSYAGATLGPSAGRIPGGELEIDGKLYKLTKNEADHHLHGGLLSLSKLEWSVQNIEKDSERVSVTLEIRLPDGHDGYPGNRIIQSAYILNEQNRLNIKYSAKSDAATYFNLSNHCYWNLSGDFSKPAPAHILRISADSVWLNDAEHIPTKCRPVKDSPYDFTLPRGIDSAAEGIPANGYNNLYILAGGASAVELKEPQSGRKLTVETDYPAVQFYSGGYLGNSTVLEGDIPASADCAVAFEPQETPVFQRLPPALAHPGSVWERNICYIFDVC